MKRSKCDYQYCYCEENIYKFLEKFVVAVEVEKRRATATCSSSTADAGVGDLSTSDPLPLVATPTMVVDPKHFDAAAAGVISTYRDDPRREKKNVWRSSFPIMVEDVLGLMPDEKTKPCVKSNAFSSYAVWDYHVIAFVRLRCQNVWYVVDFDSRIMKTHSDTDLLVALRVDIYMDIAFKCIHRVVSAVPSIARELKPLLSHAKDVYIRFVGAVDYLTWLRTDRSHMLTKNGDFQQPPPRWPTIASASPILSMLPQSVVASMFTPVENTGDDDGGLAQLWLQENNLASFINMRNSVSAPGVVVHRDALCEWLATESSKLVDLKR